MTNRSGRHAPQNEGRFRATRGDEPRRGRFSAIPPMPSGPRPELQVLLEVEGGLGEFLWESLADVNTWVLVVPSERARAFSIPRVGLDERLTSASSRAPELADAFRELARLSSEPGLVGPAEAAGACEKVARWAEAKGWRETAIQFAEAAARAEPDGTARSYLAGRTCRLFGEPERARIWLERAARLARRARRETDFVVAHLGLATLEHNLGRYNEAEHHAWKATRAAQRSGNKSSAGKGYHNLLAIKVSESMLEDGLKYAKLAIRHYPAHHRLIPSLAHDIGVLWMRMGHFTFALPLFEGALSHLPARDALVVYANIARCAAAVQDGQKYRAATEAALQLAESDHDLLPAALYLLGRAAHTLGEREVARTLMERALASANAWRNGTIISWTEDYLSSPDPSGFVDVDVPPGPESGIEEITQLASRRARRQRAG